MKLADIQAAAAEAESKPQAGLNDQVTVIFGDKNAGKSTGASRFKRPLFLDFEDRIRNITIGKEKKRPAQLQFDDWQGVLDFTKVMATTTPEKAGYDTIVVDGGGYAFNLLLRQLLAEHEVESWNDGSLGYMKGRDIAIKRWNDWFTDLRALTRQGFGIVMTCHETVETFENDGRTFNKRVPLISGVSNGIDHGWRAIRPSIDMIIHVSKREVEGVPTMLMRCKGTALIEAADPTPDGRLPAESVWSFKNLKAFWDGNAVKADAPTSDTPEAAEDDAEAPQTDDKGE